MAKPKVTITIHNAKIIYQNFRGEKKNFNLEGDRNFSVMLGEQQAKELEADGWNVKPMKRREEDTEQLYHLKVKVNFRNKPPRVWLCSNVDPETGVPQAKVMLGEGLIGILDELESTNVDLVFNAFDWEMQGNTGRTAYLESLFFTMYESALEREYASVRQIAAVGDNVVKELEAGGRMPYDFEGEVEEDHA